MADSLDPSDLTSRYDKVLKENQEKALPGITKRLLGLDIVKRETLASRLQHTKEREVDRLTKVTESSGKTYILNIEWQSSNDPNMLDRMLEYRVMAWQVHHLPVKQYVLYMGSGKPTMKSSLEQEDLNFRYHIVNLGEIDYKFFLESNKPEEKVLAVLGDFGGDPPEQVITRVLKEVSAEADGELSRNKYFNQLQILVQSRTLDIPFEIAMESIKTFFRIERDPLYKWGEEKGAAKEREKAEKEKLNEKIAIALKLKKMGVAVDDISLATGLSVDVIEKL